MSRTDRQLARLLRAEEPPEPPPELLETLRRDIPQLPPAPRYPKGKVEELHPRPFLGWMAAAASVVIALGASMLALRVAREAPPPGESAAVTAPHESAVAQAIPDGGAAPAAPGAEPREDLHADRDGAQALERLRAAAPVLPPAAEPPPEAEELGAVGFGAVEEPREDREAVEEGRDAATPESPLLDSRRQETASSVAADELARVPSSPDSPAQAGAARVERSLRLEAREEADAAAGVETRRAGDAPARPAAKVAAPSAVDASAAPQGAVGGVVAGGVVHRAAADRLAETGSDRLSTFSLDVGSGSYEAVRRHLEAGRMPPAEAVRIEEIVNAFAPRDPAPAAGDLAIHADGAPSPWARGAATHLLRVAVRARDARPGDPRPGVVADAARAQVEFDPRWVSRWRLVGHEAAAPADERFRSDPPLGGAVAAGRAVTAVYEVELRPSVPASARLALVRLRWRPAGSAAEVEAERVVRPPDLAPSWDAASRSLRLASVAARFGALLAAEDRGDGADLAELARRAEDLAAEAPGEPRAGELARLVARARVLQRGGG
jgi:hypothetical protein